MAGILPLPRLGLHRAAGTAVLVILPARSTPCQLRVLPYRDTVRVPRASCAVTTHPLASGRLSLLG